jgi:hypothetical protein
MQKENSQKMIEVKEVKIANNAIYHSNALSGVKG